MKKYPVCLLIIVFAAGILTVSGCNSTGLSGEMKNCRMTYMVERTKGAVVPAGNWDGPEWKGIRPVDIKYPINCSPKFSPKTAAKLQYDDNNIYVIFKTEDRYVRAAAQKNQDPVYEDSCVEFFFTPGTDISRGYFNIETNCGGTVLSRHQLPGKINKRPLSDGDIGRLAIYHSEPKIVDPEKVGPQIWYIEYKVPLSLLEKFTAIEKPALGVRWKGNFYKCGDKTSNPHWLAWSPFNVEDEARFHRPQFFGDLEFK